MKPTLPGHDGTPPGEGDLLLGDPGSSIGALLSVTTELTTAGRKRSSEDANRLVLRIVLSILAAVFGIAVADVLDRFSWAPAGAALGVLLVQLRFLRPPPATTFVGTEGLARYTKTRGNPRAEVLRWDDAGALFVAAERRMTGSAYVGTVFSYTFRGPGRRKLFEIRSVYHDGDGAPLPAQPLNLIHFAVAAEKSFTEHLLTRAKAALARGEEVPFDVTATEYIHLSAKRLTLRPQRRQPVHVPRTALLSIDIQQDLLILSVRRSGAEAVDPSGGDHLYELAYQAGEQSEEHRFRTSELPNLRLLLLLLDERLAEAPPDHE